MWNTTKRLPEIIFYVVIGLLMLGLFWRFALQNSERIQTQNLEYAEDATHMLASRIDEEFSSSLNLIDTYAYFVGASLAKPDVTESMLREIIANTAFDGIRFSNDAGINLSHDGIRTDVKDREFFQKGLRGESGIAAIMDSRIFHQPILAFYAPVQKDGKIIGVLHGSYPSDTYLRELLTAAYFGEKAEVYLCLKDGTIIASSGQDPLRVNLLEYLKRKKIIDAATAAQATETFAKGGHGAFTCSPESEAGNLCVITLPRHQFVLVQTFPRAVTQAMLNNANTAGVELEASLILLFLIAATLILIRAHVQRKNLEKRNRELALISQGMNILFNGRYLAANFETEQYTYLGDATASGVKIGQNGPYGELLAAHLDAIPGAEDREEFEGIFSLPALAREFRKHNTVTYMARMLIDGKEEWENITGICVTREEGMPHRFMVVSQNVTDMKERELRARKRIAYLDRKERQYQLAITSNAIATYEFNVSRDLIEQDVRRFVNGRSVSLLQSQGLAAPCKASEFLASFQRMLLPESAEEYARKTDMAWLRKKFYAGTREVELDFWLQSAPGVEECVRQSIYMVLDDDSGEIMAMTVLRDITAQVVKQRSQTKALQDALLLAQHANEAKTTFLSNMSHDIRTPMNAIIGFSTIAANHLDNKNQVRDCLNKVLSSSNHLLSLINDILDMSRIESGKMQIKEQPCNISELMHNLVNIIQPQVKAKQMRLFIDTFDVVNEDVITDPLKLNQVFINLLGNAVKYTPAGGIISFRMQQKPTYRHGFADYVFDVSDNGIGMAPEFVEHIFEPFTRESTTTQSGIQGTGLGMAITRNIVELLDGNISVQSEPGKGTTFTVSLTLRLQDGVANPEDLKCLEGLRALVVDDDFNVCDSVSKMLKKIGLRPEWTTSGREAVYRAQFAHDDMDPFSTYIIDWQMPDMNGVDTARKIREIVGKDKPIIILTAYEWADIEEEARKVGVTAFCSKPLFMSDLKNALLSSHGMDAEAEGEPDTAKFENARILLVDDLEMNREVAEFILSENGFEVECAPDGSDAVEMVRNSPENYFDAILMDVQMPTMNGYEATREIRNMDRKDVKTMPILAMTANALVEDKAQALKSGMNDHIAKPIDVKQFFTILDKYFERQQDK